MAIPKAAPLIHIDAPSQFWADTASMLHAPFHDDLASTLCPPPTYMHHDLAVPGRPATNPGLDGLIAVDKVCFICSTALHAPHRCTCRLTHSPPYLWKVTCSCVRTFWWLQFDSLVALMVLVASAKSVHNLLAAM